MAEGDRLRRLQMGETGHHRGGMLLGLRHQRVLQIAELRAQMIHGVADI
jgi:hypothetical protein